MLGVYLNQMLAVNANLCCPCHAMETHVQKWVQGCLCYVLHQQIVAAYQIYCCKFGNFAAAMSIKNAKQAAVGVKV